MSDKMKLIPFRKLLYWIIEEYENQGTIFGIPESHFFRKTSGNSISIFNEECDIPIGPAAGPHTQIAQNIITAYLTGARYFELKTVQKLDSLEIEKPCIDAADECYNTEWSTELSLEEAFEEYVKGWILIHFVNRYIISEKNPTDKFIFNISAGYDFEGIISPRMETFFTSMKEPQKHPFYKKCLTEVDHFISTGRFYKETGHPEKSGVAHRLSENISADICVSLTLSTMHGCPPAEIEKICHYLVTKKKINTFVKLNPTLLGYDTVRSILDDTGFSYIKLSPEAFAKDLQYKDAIGILKRVKEASDKSNTGFGIKLSNTLGVINDKDKLPGNEMYMSGRALFPLTIKLAALLAEELNGALPISFSGGANRLNIKDILETGIRPVTAATEFLKPGGYLRLREMVQIYEGMGKLPERIDTAKIKVLSEKALKMLPHKKKWRDDAKVSIPEDLPLTDCAAAPCKAACPINQDVPGYLRKISEKKYDEALSLIYSDNPLPFITGHICDHECMTKCSRLDYDGAVNIRSMKLSAAEKGSDDFLSTYTPPKISSGKISAAVIGAGPAGLASAYFLAKAGFKVTVFEKEETPGGVVRHIIPPFRIPETAIKKDIDFIKHHGVEFKFGTESEDQIKTLKNKGYKYIITAIGAEMPFNLSFSEGKEPYDALNFLKAYKLNPESINIGPHVAVVGGGNTAMDSARAAMRISDVKTVTIIYRRTQKEMPADKEEFIEAMEEGIKFSPLMNPVSFSGKGKLKCEKMKLGEPGLDGRQKPMPTGEFTELSIDTVITAIGAYANTEFFKENNIKTEKNGRPVVDIKTLETSVEGIYLTGDALRGPSTIVKAIADGKKVSRAIMGKEGLDKKGKYSREEDLSGYIPGIMEKKGKIYNRESNISESDKCFSCDIICNKCVEVCPNRANFTVEINEDIFRNKYQIVHLDAPCNECGNCETFCPYDGAPYKDKLTLYSDKSVFDKETKNGFFIQSGSSNFDVEVRVNKKSYKIVIDKEGSISSESQGDKELESIWKIIAAICIKFNYLIDL